MNATSPYLDDRSRFVTVDGLEVHYRREGQGPALLLIHGSGSTLHSYDRIAEGLVLGCTVIRLDLPGFGFTGPRADRDYRIETYVEVLAAFLTAIGVDRAHVAGHSLGGNIAWNFAVEHPERVESLVLLNATGYPEKSLPTVFRLARNPILRPLLRRWAPKGATKKNLRASVGPASTVDDAMVARVSAMLDRPGNRSAFIDFANTDQSDRSGLIRKITAPTLVVRSDLIDGQHFGRDIPQSREVVLARVGHLMPEEAPREVTSILRAHLGLAPLEP